MAIKELTPKEEALFQLIRTARRAAEHVYIESDTERALVPALINAQAAVVLGKKLDEISQTLNNIYERIPAK